MRLGRISGSVAAAPDSPGDTRPAYGTTGMMPAFEITNEPRIPGMSQIRGSIIKAGCTPTGGLRAYFIHEMTVKA